MSKFSSNPCLGCEIKKTCAIRRDVPYLAVAGCVYYIPRLTKHRRVISEAVGRIIDHNEHVHRINGIHSDNRLDNLFLCTPSEHSLIHQMMKRGLSKFQAIDRTMRRRERRAKGRYAKDAKRSNAYKNASPRNDA